MNSEPQKETIFTLDRFEGGKAILIGEHQKIEIPKRLIPKDVGEGDILHMILASDEWATKDREKKAKELLNEILSGSKKKKK